MVKCSDPEKEAARRRKIGAANRGRCASDETKAKMSAVRKGRPHSKEHAENIGKALKGRVITPEWREKLRAARIGKTASDETKSKMSASKVGANNKFYGRTHSEETRKFISKYRIDNKLSEGKNNPMYIDGSSFLPYCEKFNNDFRRRVRSFYGNTCQLCGHVSGPLEKNMAVHHVNYKKDACCNQDIIPLFVTVCPDKCHQKTNWDRDYWEICFTQLIKNKYGGKCYFTKEEFKNRNL